MNNDIQNLRNQADAHRKAGRFAEAIPLYQAIWQATQDEPDKWDGWGYAQCLRKTGQSAEALEICRVVYNLDTNFDHNNSLYGWCIYDIGIRQPEATFDEARFLKAAEAIMQVTAQGEYSPYERAVFAVVKYFEKQSETQKPVPHGKILEWLDRLDVSQLSTQLDKGTDGKTYPSARERWYTSRAKALLELERHEECVDICSQALEVFRKPHFDFDIWFRIYRAQSNAVLRQFEAAARDLEYAMARKPDLWMRQRYAAAMRELGDIDMAVGYASEAALSPHGLGFRWEVFLDLGLMLADKGEDELATRHILLAAAIRNEEGWPKVPQRLQDALNHYHLSAEETPSAKALHKELQPFWKSMKPRPQTSHSGIILTIHTNGKSGHIKGDNGGKYFFAMSNYKGESAAIRDLRVRFNLREALDKAGKPEMHAVDVIEEGA